MTLLTDIPTLDQLAVEPERAKALSRDAAFGLFLRAQAVTMVCALALADARDPVREDRLLTLAEAAERLGRTVDWVKRNQHRLPFAIREAGRHPRFSLLGIESWIAEQTGQGARWVRPSAGQPTGGARVRVPRRPPSASSPARS